MKKMDEMDRSIQLRSEEWGYRTALLALCAWTVFNACRALADGAELDMLPCLILCLSLCVQGFSQIVLKRKMIAGDEEYKEPNQVIRTIVLTIIIVAVVLAVGVSFFQKA